MLRLLSRSCKLAVRCRPHNGHRSCAPCLAHGNTWTSVRGAASSGVEGGSVAGTSSASKPSELGRDAKPDARRTHLASPKTSPPQWIEQLRSDAATFAKSISYDIKIYDEMVWCRKSFTFDVKLWDPLQMSAMVRRRLCLGDEKAEYTVIGEAFPFPDREDSPVVNVPQRMCRLLWDHNSPTQKLLIQLSDHFPPLLWLSVRPTLSALKKVFGEFLEVDVQHMKKYLPYYEELQHRVEARMEEKLTDTLNPTYLKDRFTEDMRKRDPRTLEMDYPNEHHLYLGMTPHFTLVEDRMMKSNPFVFGWPQLLSGGNEHLEDTPLRMAAFRTIFSKSLLMFHSRLDLQVNPRHARLPGDVDEETILTEMPLFCTVNYAPNSRLCGGRPLVQRYNTVMGTNYPLDMPVDVLAAFAREATVKSSAELLAELRFLTEASLKLASGGQGDQHTERVFRLSEDQLSCNRILGQLAYTIVYLALVSYPRFIKDVFEVYVRHDNPIVRVACAKGAQIFGRPDLIAPMVEREPEGRSKTMLRAMHPTEAEAQ